MLAKASLDPENPRRPWRLVLTGVNRRTEENSLASAASSNSRAADTDVTAQGAGSHRVSYGL